MVDEVAEQSVHKKKKKREKEEKEESSVETKVIKVGLHRLAGNKTGWPEIKPVGRISGNETGWPDIWK